MAIFPLIVIGIILLVPTLGVMGAIIASSLSNFQELNPDQ